MRRCMVDSDTLSEAIKGKNSAVVSNAEEYLEQFGSFTFSIITQYEILRGFAATSALTQMARFESLCADSEVLELSAKVVERAAVIYGDLKKRGRLIGDADILIAATALVHSLPLATGNTKHFGRIKGLDLEDWSV
jgi:tRNA(fMet)-specific endonuclease VapC